MAPEFLSGLMEYDWPGNVRELQNTIERAYYSTIGALLDAQSLRLSLCPSSKPPAEPASGGRRAALRPHPLRRQR